MFATESRGVDVGDKVTYELGFKLVRRSRLYARPDPGDF